MCHKLMPILLVPCSINHLFLFQELVEKTVCLWAPWRGLHTRRRLKDGGTSGASHPRVQAPILPAPVCSRRAPAASDVARPRQSEVEETMKRLGSYPGFMGYVIINADGIPIRRSVPSHVPPLAACRAFGECAPQCAVTPAVTAGEHLSALHTLGRCFVTAPCGARPLLACSPSQLPGPPRCSAVRGAAVDVVPKVALGSARARPVQRRDVPASAIT